MPVLFYTAMFCGAPPAHKHALLAHGALRVFQCLAPNSPCNSAALWVFFFLGGGPHNFHHTSWRQVVEAAPPPTALTGEAPEGSGRHQKVPEGCGTGWQQGCSARHKITIVSWGFWGIFQIFEENQAFLYALSHSKLWAETQHQWKCRGGNEPWPPCLRGAGQTETCTARRTCHCEKGRAGQSAGRSWWTCRPHTPHQPPLRRGMHHPLTQLPSAPSWLPHLAAAWGKINPKGLFLPIRNCFTCLEIAKSGTSVHRHKAVGCEAGSGFPQGLGVVRGSQPLRHVSRFPGAGK